MSGPGRVEVGVKDPVTIFKESNGSPNVNATFKAEKYPFISVPDDPSKTRIYTLKNGLTVYLSQNKAEPRIQTYIAVRAGSKNDPKETTGLAHYLEHMMFKGTGNIGTTNWNREKVVIDSISH